MDKTFYNRVSKALNENYVDHLWSLHELSKDDSNNEHLCQSRKEGFCYDDITKLLFKNETPCSPDGIFLDLEAEKVVLIEFKNGKIKNSDKKDLKLKGIEGMYNLIRWVAKDLSLLPEKHLEYMVVYNSEKQTNKQSKPNKEAIEKRVGELALQRPIRFGLSRLKNTYFKDVITMDQYEFDRKFS